MLRSTLLILGLLFAPVALAAPPGPSHAAPRGAQVREHEAQMLEFLSEAEPEAYQRMIRLRDESVTSDARAAYLYRLSKVTRRVRAERDDPERFARKQEMRDKERAVRALAEGAGELPKAEKKVREAELHALVTELFALRQEERKARLVELEARLEQLRTEISDRDADRDQIIDDFVDGLLNPMPDL